MPGQGIRPCRQRLGAGRRLGAYSPRRRAGTGVQGARDRRGRSPAQVRLSA